MYPDPFQLSLDTVIATSTLLGHKLEDRARVREAQDRALVENFQRASSIPLSNPGQAGLFLVAPLDILVTDVDGEMRFHVIETNGTGIGGLTNMTADAVSAVLTGLTQFGRELPESEPAVLVAVSGKESSRHPRLNKTVYEKLLYAEALKKGFEARRNRTVVTTMSRVLEDPKEMQAVGPVIVLGYIKELLQELALESDGRLSLFGRPVSAAVNDRFCLNVLSRFMHQVDLGRLHTMNRCFMAGADKGTAYALLNEYTRLRPDRFFADRVDFERASCRGELIAKVLDSVGRGRKVVIKPQGTGLGHGIEFFLSRDEPKGQILDKIDHSIRLTEHYYGAIGGAFPYTLTEFISARTINRPGHPLDGHKYELRIVVYWNRMALKAFPSIVKVSSQGYDAARPVRLSLINNITTSAEARKAEGVEFMLPLSNNETLDLLGLEPEHVERLCAFCTGYVRYILDQVQKAPERFGLPSADGNVA